MDLSMWLLMEFLMLNNNMLKQFSLNTIICKKEKMLELKQRNKNKSEKIKGKRLEKKDKKIKSFKNLKMRLKN
jgi:hypothetical protein